MDDVVPIPEEFDPALALAGLGDDDGDDALPADEELPELAAIPTTAPDDMPPDVGNLLPEGLVVATDFPELDGFPVPGDAVPVSGGSISGLDRAGRLDARRIAVKAAELGLSRKATVRYTQDAKRWDGIANRRYVKDGKVPVHADCSSFVTWCLWNALKVKYGLGDTVNRSAWQQGYTGTLLSSGKRVASPDNWLLGDLFIYGAPGSTGAHVTIHVGGGKAISHGSDAAPFKVDWNYRADLMEVRRYI